MASDHPVGDVQARLATADVRHQREFAPKGRRLVDDAPGELIPARDGGLAGGRVRSVEGRERAACLCAQRLHLVPERRQVRIRRVEEPRHLGVAGGRQFGPCGRPGRVVHPGHEPGGTERDDEDDRDPDETTEERADAAHGATAPGWFMRAVPLGRAAST